MGLSITGITLMQIHWMLKTIRLNEENFDRAVNETLASVVDKLEKEKDIRFSIPFQSPSWYQNIDEPRQEDIKERHNFNSRTYVVSKNATKSKHNNFYRFKQRDRNQENTVENDSNKRDLVYESYTFDDHGSPKSYKSFEDSIEKSIKYKEFKNPENIRVTVGYTDTISSSVKVVQGDSLTRIIIISNGRADTIDSRDLPRNLIPPPPPPPTEVGRIYMNDGTNQFIARRKSRPINRTDYRIAQRDSNNRYKYEEEVIALNNKEVEAQTKKQQQALKQLFYEMDARKVDLKDRVNSDELKNLLTVELKNKGLTGDFEFALVTKDSKRNEVYSTPQFNRISTESTYATRLFPNNFVPLNDYLEIKFPNKDTAIYKSVIFPISASLFFTMIVFLTFTITLVTIIKQKKLAEMKADFINNMTHELKTPIATISLASDSIDNPKVVEKPESVKYFTAIIREENARMNKLVESVLQTARLERKTLKLNLKEVNLSNLTERVADQMGIQAKAKEGLILFSKPDEDLYLIADENLMENVIFNLIDNAIKYSSSSPKVIVTLKKLPGGLSLSVEDNGIGMSRSEQQRVFEKFYRISQGDVHNIKGFGLGLSNVKEITELHGGMVQVRSELGKGSTFSLFFPNKVNGNE